MINIAVGCNIDFRKAFDRVWRVGLWEVMRHMGYPEKIARILEKMYERTFNAVRAAEGLSEWFETVFGCCRLKKLKVNFEIYIADRKATTCI